MHIEFSCTRVPGTYIEHVYYTYVVLKNISFVSKLPHIIIACFDQIDF